MDYNYEAINSGQIEHVLKAMKQVFPNDLNNIQKELQSSILSEENSIYKIIRIKKSLQKVDGLIGVNYDFKNKIAWLGWFFIQDEFRNEGYGSKIIKDVIQSVKKKNIDFLCAWTTEEEIKNFGADKFYKKNTFKEYKNHNYKYYGSNVSVYFLNLGDQISVFQLPEPQKWLF